MDLPFRIFRPFLGARIIKTGLAVFLSLLVVHAVNPDYAAYAAVAAIPGVQPSYNRARQVFVQSVLSNLMGGLVGAVLGYYLGSGSLSMSLAVVVVLGLCVQFHLTETAGSAVVAVLFIMDRPEHDFLLYTFARIAAIIAGTLIATLVNRFVRPPDFNARIRAELGAAARDVETFFTHLLMSLGTPEHYLKEQIKAEAKAINRRLETAGYFLDLLHESSNPAAAHKLLPFDKAKASLFVFIERIMDIHKIVLQAEGLRPGAELGAVAGALKAVEAYKTEVMRAMFEGGPPDPVPAANANAAAGALAQLVETLIADGDTRPRGLALHSILTNIRHMTWRMDSLTRLLADR